MENLAKEQKFSQIFQELVNGTPYPDDFLRQILESLIQRVSSPQASKYSLHYFLKVFIFLHHKNPISELPKGINRINSLFSSISFPLYDILDMFVSKHKNFSSDLRSFVIFSNFLSTRLPFLLSSAQGIKLGKPIEFASKLSSDVNSLNTQMKMLITSIENQSFDCSLLCTSFGNLLEKIKPLLKSHTDLLRIVQGPINSLKNDMIGPSYQSFIQEIKPYLSKKLDKLKTFLEGEIFGSSTLNDFHFTICCELLVICDASPDQKPLSPAFSDFETKVQQVFGEKSIKEVIDFTLQREEFRKSERLMINSSVNELIKSLQEFSYVVLTRIKDEYQRNEAVACYSIYFTSVKTSVDPSYLNELVSLFNKVDFFIQSFLDLKLLGSTSQKFNNPPSISDFREYKSWFISFLPITQ